MTPTRSLESALDERFGFTDLPGAASVKRSGLKLRKEVKLMDTPTKKRDWLRTPVLELLQREADREWTAIEVRERIGHDNLDSINSTLSELHRKSQYPVKRVAPGRYACTLYRSTNKLVEKVERITRGETLRVGDLLEVVFVRGGKVLAIDSDDNLLVISARTVENF